MRIHKIYDNPRFKFRYVVMADKYLWAGSMLWPSYIFDESDMLRARPEYLNTGDHLGREISLDDLPLKIQRKVKALK